MKYLKDFTLEEAQSYLSANKRNKQNLVKIATERFFLQSSQAIRMSRTALIHEIEKHIRNEETHEAIARACMKEV